MRVFIAEDEPLAIERLRLLLSEYDPSIHIAGTAQSVQEAVEWLSTHPTPDLLFLDIELADGKSFNILLEITIDCPVIFVTAYDQYAMKAFSMISVDYLLKPVTLPALANALKKYKEWLNFARSNLNTLVEQAVTTLEKNFKQRFLVKVGIRMFFIESQEVAWFCAENKTVHLINTEGSRFLIDHTLETLEEIMDPKRFCRLNRKIICHQQSIKEIRSFLNNRLKLLLQAGNQKEEVIVSRERVHSFKLWADV